MRCLRFSPTGSRLTQSQQRVVRILRRRHDFPTGCCRNALLFPTAISTCRTFSLSSVSAILIPPVIFTGLLVTLWTYKCVMMIVFQNKIIYMPSVPPFSRSEKTQNYSAQCRPVTWKEHDLRAADGVALKMLEGGIEIAAAAETEPKTHVVILYLQGNASSLPPRMPLLSPVLKSLYSTNGSSTNQTRYTIYALSYRGFWTSRGRATQPGIELDVQAALSWLSAHFPQNQLGETKLVLWGQSIGAAIATTALASHLAPPSPNSPAAPPRTQPLPVHSLILETPFLSMRSMLVALYPQKFLPYRYLWPFLRSTWDSEAAIKSIAQSAVPMAVDAGQQQQQGRPGLQEILILQAGKDEIVPAEQCEALDRVCRQSLPGVHVRMEVVEGALHTEVMTRAKGREAVVRLLKAVGGRGPARLQR